ncbi:hypothetical protein [Vibrio scophthalmi]|uniref:Resolvase HTH domain-containing protein n=1 Tax=Vibrio scophthalmi TaxID=45658 RepID=A0A1E3WGV8_9VIBR|nr:hypothetical protein [Vibrio scophthalmi]ODS05039.1 hypothetical protein VSF3289_04179 [Vibrio scophthalmi]
MRTVNAEIAQKCRTVHLLVSDGETVSMECKVQGVGRVSYYKYLSAQN